MNTIFIENAVAIFGIITYVAVVGVLSLIVMAKIVSAALAKVPKSTYKQISIAALQSSTQLMIVLTVFIAGGCLLITVMSLGSVPDECLRGGYNNGCPRAEYFIQLKGGSRDMFIGFLMSSASVIALMWIDKLLKRAQPNGQAA